MDEFAHRLIAEGPAPELAEPLETFGRFVGSWRVRNSFRSAPDAEWVSSERTWIFSWVLGGRAVEDVLVGSDRGDAPVTAGATMRAYDPAIDAWRVHWYGTLHGNHVSLIGRRDGDAAIRQEGLEHTADGDVPVRWDFSAITADSFAWDGWTRAGERDWWLEQHMDAVRIV